MLTYFIYMLLCTHTVNNDCIQLGDTKMSEFKMYEDQSIFQDTLEFNTPGGMLRAEGGKDGIYKIFEQEGNTWVFKNRSIISKPDQSKKGINLNKAIYYNYINE